MEYKSLGRTGVKVSVIGLGTMTFGRQADEAEAAAIVDRALAAGVTFIDTRPAVEEPEAEAARVSDLVLVPVGTSLDDLEAVGDTLKMVRRIGRKTVIIVNAAKNEARAKDTRAALAAYPFAVCPAHLTDRSAFLDATTEGRGVSEMQGAGARAAEAELRAVWQWILEQGEE